MAPAPPKTDAHFYTKWWNPVLIHLEACLTDLLDES